MHNSNSSKVAVIGSGFAGMSAAAHLAQSGLDVHVFEKNDRLGGRARQYSQGDYLFDMGPSWYWMPEVFEKFFNHFNHKASDFYDLKLLDPSFTVIFGEEDKMEVPANFDALIEMFEGVEPGSGKKLIQFMDEAEYKYRVGIDKLVYKPGLSLLEFVDQELISGALRMHVFTSLSNHIKKFFKNPKLIALMEFPSLFLGAMPETTPALYSLMNYAGLKLGTWYPLGGFGRVIQAMKEVGEELGVTYHTNHRVDSIISGNSHVEGLVTNDEKLEFDGIIGASDYHHIETLLAENKRNYTEQYWSKRTFAPSSLIFYLGVNRKIDKFDHHNLFFDADLRQHAQEIYTHPSWPSNPLFYVCCPSKTDSSVAPKGHENLFILMPLAPGVVDTDELREKYFEIIMDRITKYLGYSIAENIDYKRSYCVTDFVSDYNAYKGNAYGLANTLRQTAILKPKIKNKKIKNLYYAGQLTVPGPGVPPSIISGEVAANQMIKNLKPAMHEVTV